MRCLVGGLARRWRSLTLAACYGWFAWDITTSPFQPWFAAVTWQAMYWVAAGLLGWQWLRPSPTVLHFVFVAFPLVGLLRGLAVWESSGSTQGFINSLVVMVLASAVYGDWRGRFDD